MRTADEKNPMNFHGRAQVNQLEGTMPYSNGSRQFFTSSPIEETGRIKMDPKDCKCSDIHRNGDLKAGCNIFALQCTCQLLLVGLPIEYYG